MKTTIIILSLAFFISCKTDKQYKLSESEINMVMAAYKKGWIDGANASTNAANNLQPFGQEIGMKLFKLDSLEAVKLLIED